MKKLFHRKVEQQQQHQHLLYTQLRIVQAKMILSFDQQSHYFEKPPSPDSTVATNVQHLLSSIIGDGHDHNNTGNGLNDLGFYLKLCARRGCKRVSIRAINIYHNHRFCTGIQVVYRVEWYSDQSKRRYTGSFVAPGYVYEPPLDVDDDDEDDDDDDFIFTDSYEKYRLELDAGEYLVDIRPTQHTSNVDGIQREVVGRIEFVTNKRTVSYGCDAISHYRTRPLLTRDWIEREDISSPVDITKKIVALVGTAEAQARALVHLGHISISLNWEIVGPIILLRDLVEKNRVYASTLHNGDRYLTDDEAVTQTLIVDATEDIFRRVLSFLADGIKV